MSALPRRLLLRLAASALAAAAALPGCASAQPSYTPSYTISARQMQQALAERFPRSYPAAGGLLALQLQPPHLTLLPERNRLNALMDVTASGPLLQERRYSGAFDVDFALRYEPSDRTLRAHALQVNALRLDGLQGAGAELLQRYGQRLAEQSLREVVLHQLQDKDLAFTDALGVQPERITVTAQGLVVRFGPKPLP